MSKEQTLNMKKPKTEEHIRNIIESKKRNMSGCKKIICLNNGIIYDSIGHACRALGVTGPNVVNVLKKRAENTKKFKFEYYEE